MHVFPSTTFNFEFGNGMLAQPLVFSKATPAEPFHPLHPLDWMFRPGKMVSGRMDRTAGDSVC
jgi:hypothetical protein